MEGGNPLMPVTVWACESVLAVFLSVASLNPEDDAWRVSRADPDEAIVENRTNNHGGEVFDRHKTNLYPLERSAYPN